MKSFFIVENIFIKSFFIVRKNFEFHRQQETTSLSFTRNQCNPKVRKKKERVKSHNHLCPEVTWHERKFEE